MTEVVAYRTANWDRPFWVNPNRRESRWTPAGSNLVVQYWSLHPLTPWAEVLRAQNVRDPVDAKSFYLRPWVGIIQLPGDTVHLSFDAAPDHGPDPDALIDDDWSRCQNWVHAVRPTALVTPSAALPGTENLVLFGPRVRVRYGLRPIDPGLEVPCDPVANFAIVVDDLVQHVRWRGQDHAGYRAWMSGAPTPSPPLVRVPRL